MQHAIITGGSRGIGREVALALGRTGSAVTVNYRADADAARSVVDALAEVGARGHAVQADVTDPVQVRRLFADAGGALGPPDVLVLNAGVPGFAAIDDVTDADYERVFAAPARGLFTLLQEGARRLSDGGRIVVVSWAAPSRRTPATRSTAPPRRWWTTGRPCWPRSSARGASRSTASCPDSPTPTA